MTEIFKQLALAGDVWVLWLLIATSVLSLGVISGGVEDISVGESGFPAQPPRAKSGSLGVCGRHQEGPAARSGSLLNPRIATF